MTKKGNRSRGQSPKVRGRGPGFKRNTVTLRTKGGYKTMEIRVYRQMVNDLKLAKRRALQIAEGSFVGKAKSWAKDYI